MPDRKGAGAVCQVTGSTADRFQLRFSGIRRGREGLFRGKESRREAHANIGGSGRQAARRCGTDQPVSFTRIGDFQGPPGRAKKPLAPGVIGPHQFWVAVDARQSQTLAGFGG